VLLKRHTNNDIQTNLALHEDSDADWLPACSQKIIKTLTGLGRFLMFDAVQNWCGYLHKPESILNDKNGIY
jgi:hypothetical protein